MVGRRVLGRRLAPATIELTPHAALPPSLIFIELRGHTSSTPPLSIRPSKPGQSFWVGRWVPEWRSAPATDELTPHAA